MKDSDPINNVNDALSDEALKAIDNIKEDIGDKVQIESFEHQGYHQIETNLEPQELLGALASSGLITQEEMIGAYKELGLSPQNRAIGNGLHPMDTPNQPPPNLPSFSLF